MGTGAQILYWEKRAGENIFRIRGTGEQANHFKGTREQLSPGRASTPPRLFM